MDNNSNTTDTMIIPSDSAASVGSAIAEPSTMVALSTMTEQPSTAYSPQNTHIDDSSKENQKPWRRHKSNPNSEKSEWHKQKEQKRQARRHIPLNYYNLFWIFVLCSMAGLAIETLYHWFTVGDYQSRAGLIWGPFSPIYGNGAVLLTIALNRFWDKNVLVIFVASMILGSALEYCTSWLLQNLLGIVAWDYGGTFGSIEGRINIAFGLMWGTLGIIWVRLLLPGVLWVIRKIPFKWHIGLTALVSIFMIANIAITVIALDREYQRSIDVPATNIVQTLCDEHFPDSFLRARFENMELYPDSVIR